jgi:hypothetical protein
MAETRVFGTKVTATGNILERSYRSFCVFSLFSLGRQALLAILSVAAGPVAQ